MLITQPSNWPDCIEPRIRSHALGLRLFPKTLFADIRVNFADAWVGVCVLGSHPQIYSPKHTFLCSGHPARRVCTLRINHFRPCASLYGFFLNRIWICKCPPVPGHSVVPRGCSRPPRVFRMLGLRSGPSRWGFVQLMHISDLAATHPLYTIGFFRQISFFTHLEKRSTNLPF